LNARIIDRLYEGLEPAASSNGYEIVLIETIGGSKAPTVRIYIDTPDGVGFDELSAAQVWIDQVVEAIDPFPGAYTLEVSSPGIDRPLRTRAHFERWAGEEVVVKTGTGRTTKVTGVLQGLDGDDIVVDVEGEPCRIAFEDITKAHVVGRIDFSTELQGKEPWDGI
jgi:ribosome maturation factor RimP